MDSVPTIAWRSRLLTPPCIIWPQLHSEMVPWQGQLTVYTPSRTTWTVQTSRTVPPIGSSNSPQLHAQFQYHRHCYALLRSDEIRRAPDECGEAERTVVISKFILFERHIHVRSYNFVVIFKEITDSPITDIQWKYCILNKNFAQWYGSPSWPFSERKTMAERHNRTGHPDTWVDWVVRVPNGQYRTEAVHVAGLIRSNYSASWSRI